MSGKSHNLNIWRVASLYINSAQNEGLNSQTVAGSSGIVTTWNVWNNFWEDSGEFPWFLLRYFLQHRSTITGRET